MTQLICILAIAAEREFLMTQISAVIVENIVRWNMTSIKCEKCGEYSIELIGDQELTCECEVE